MTTYVALLRGINVGRGPRVSMADLRDAVTSAGGRDVVTYVNSGNVVLDHDVTDETALVALLEAAVTEGTGVPARVLVRTARELDETVAANPFPHEQDPTRVHAVFLPAPPDDATLAHTVQAQQTATDRGSSDRLELIGRVAYLHTPTGLGRSALADLLNRRTGLMTIGTTRNWRTVTRLQTLCTHRDH